MTRANLIAVALVVGLATLAAAPASADILVVDGRSNIFGAGHATAPDPGGSAGVGPGGGLLPPSVSFSAGPDSVLEFSAVTGTVSIDIRSKPFHGPDGDTTYTPTNVSSFGGISGIRDGRTLFLVGVFLSDVEPSDPAPPVLDFTGNEGFAQLAPALDQTFFVGDGLTGTGTGSRQRFLVPAGATRLFLGFADSFNGSSITGQPGFYDDNGGALTATFTISAVPEPSSLVLSGVAVVCGLGAWLTRRRVDGRRAPT